MRAPTVKAGKEREGFDFVGMLVVMGVIVAFAAVMIPLVVYFSGIGAPTPN